MEFQINQDVKFVRNQSLLDKADALTPSLKKTVVKPRQLVNVKEQATSLYGYDAVPDARPVANLHDYPCAKGDQLILDLGDHYVGHFAVDIDAVGSPMDAPLFLHVKFAEVPIELVEDSADYDGVLSKSWLQDEYIHLDTLPQRLELPRRYACRYIMLDVVDTSPKWQAVFSHPEFVAESAVDLAEVQPVNTGDDLLDAVDQVGLKTLQDCMQQVFEDGPKRDRRLWVGDLRLQALANYATFDNQNLVKRCLYLFGGFPTEDGRITTNVFTFTDPVPDDSFFFDYSLFFVSAIADYYQHYQDIDTVRSLYDVAKRDIDVILKAVDSDNLVDLGEKWFCFVDWNMDFDRATCAQAILIYTLKQFVTLAKVVGATADVQNYQKWVERLSMAARTHCFDATRGLFVSGPAHEINVASQVWMALAHVLPDEQNKQLMDVVLAQLFPVHGITTPYMYHHIASALFETDHTQEGINLIKSYWGLMVQHGADTFWEAFDPDAPAVSPYGSLAINSFCHAWSCTPVYLIRKYVTKTYQD